MPCFLPPRVQKTRWADFCQDFQDLRIPRALNLNIVSVILGEDNDFLEKWWVPLGQCFWYLKHGQQTMLLNKQRYQTLGHGMISSTNNCYLPSTETQSARNTDLVPALQRLQVCKERLRMYTINQWKIKKKVLLELYRSEMLKKFWGGRKTF